MQSDLLQLPGDNFGAHLAPVDDFATVEQHGPGWCGRYYAWQFEVANGEVMQSGPLPLPTPTADFTHDELAQLHFAFLGIDEHLHLFGGAQHVYLGCSIVKVAVQIGDAEVGRARFELRDPATRFLEFACEGAERAIPILQVQGRKMMQQLAAQALAEVLSKLIARPK